MQPPYKATQLQICQTDLYLKRNALYSFLAGNLSPISMTSPYIRFYWNVAITNVENNVYSHFNSMNSVIKCTYS